jgi:hypothetical protein
LAAERARCINAGATPSDTHARLGLEHNAISTAAASLEQAVILELEEARDLAEIVPALESLLEWAGTVSAQARRVEIDA